MLKLKDAGVIVAKLKPEMYFALGIADWAFGVHGHDCVITAALDGKHNPGSKHALGLAVDIRNEQCDDAQKQVIFTMLQRLEKYGFDVINEEVGDTPATTATHFHIEYDPKPGERPDIFMV
jgi:hypothetical protein